MNGFKKDLACNITLIVALTFTLLHLLLITLDLFGAVSLHIYEGFNYIVAYVLIILCLALFIFSFFITRFKNLEVPAWFRIVFYVAFFLFTNTYYIVGGYKNIFSIIVFFVYLSFLSTVANISVFYNVQKDEKNKLKTSRNYIVTSVFFYSLGTNAIIELFITAFKSFVFPNYEFTTVNTFIIEMSTMILTTIILCFIISMSLKRTKRLVNSCLIKINSAKPKQNQQ